MKQVMIQRTKIGDCQNEGCLSINTNCIKVGKIMYCIKCRNKLKLKDMANKITSDAIKKPKRKRIPLDDEMCLYINELDNLASRYIRMKYADSNSQVNCYTCNWEGHWKLSDCGHFVSRKNYAVRWDVRNLKVQCISCNREKGGNLAVYAEKLENESPGITSELTDISRFVHKVDRQELREMIIDFRYKIKAMGNKFITK